MSLDSQLLAQKPETGGSAGRAGGLREAQRSRSRGSKAARPNNFRKDEGAVNDQGEAPKSLREAVIEEKKKKEASGGEGAGGQIAAAAPMRKGTSKLLQQAWINTIDSFGLTLIWVNIHVFLSYIFGEKLFCKLGEEWADMMGGGTVQAPGVSGVKPPIKASNKCCVLAGCDLGCLFIILAIACLIAMMVGVITNPLEAISSLLTGIWGAITGASK